MTHTSPPETCHLALHDTLCSPNALQIMTGPPWLQIWFELVRWRCRVQVQLDGCASVAHLPSWSTLHCCELLGESALKRREEENRPLQDGGRVRSSVGPARGGRSQARAHRQGSQVGHRADARSRERRDAVTDGWQGSDCRCPVWLPGALLQRDQSHLPSDPVHTPRRAQRRAG